MTQSPFAWPGGKRSLTSRLLPLLPDHHTYVEVFAGGAKLLFAKPLSAFEVMNDLNGDVTNFYRVCKHRPAELTELLALECIHGGRFRELREQKPFCEVERALQFAYLTWYSFGSKGEHFAQGNAAQGCTRKPLTRVKSLLTNVAKRLAAVQIETQDFAVILRRYDAANTFFYLDPPYVQFSDIGRYRPLDEVSREAMFSQLAGLQGKFLMSFDDHPEIRSRVGAYGFHLREERVFYSLSAKNSGRRKAPELLISNYPLSVPVS